MHASYRMSSKIWHASSLTFKRLTHRGFWSLPPHPEVEIGRDYGPASSLSDSRMGSGLSSKDLGPMSVGTAFSCLPCEPFTPPRTSIFCTLCMYPPLGFTN